MASSSGQKKGLRRRVAVFIVCVGILIKVECLLDVVVNICAVALCASLIMLSDHMYRKKPRGLTWPYMVLDVVSGLIFGFGCVFLLQYASARHFSWILSGVTVLLAAFAYICARRTIRARKLDE